MDGPTNNGNGALDSGAGIVMNGGTVVAVGSSGMVEAPSANSGVFSANIYFNTSLPANTKLEIKDSADNTIIGHTTAKTFTNAVVGSAEFSLGNTYTIYINGDKYQDFTIGDTVTIVGDSRTNINTMPPKTRK